MVRFLVLTLILLMPAAWGRSPFMSALKPYLKAHVDLTETLFSLSFTLGNIVAAFTVPVFVCFLGKNFSLTKAFRAVYVWFILGFLSFFGAMGCYGRAGCFIFLVIGYWGVRSCGQGLLPTLICSYGALLYDDKKCAWLSSWHISVQMFGSIVLYVLSAFKAFEWWHRVLWAQIFILLLYVICVPKHLPKLASIEIHSPRKFGLVFKRFPLVFIFGMCLLALENFHATGIMFHISNFASEQSVPLEKIFKIFFPLTIFTLVFTPLASWVYTRTRLSFILFLQILSLVLTNAILLKLNNDINLWLFAVANGLAWAFNHVLSYALVSKILPETQRAIGYSTLIGFGSLCSAIGPFVYSCLFAVFGNYMSVGRFMFVINSAIALWVLYLCLKPKRFGV